MAPLVKIYHVFIALIHMDMSLNVHNTVLILFIIIFAADNINLYNYSEIYKRNILFELYFEFSSYYIKCSCIAALVLNDKCLLTNLIPKYPYFKFNYLAK